MPLTSRRSVSGMEALPVKTSRDVITLINTRSDFVVANVVVIFDCDRETQLSAAAAECAAGLNALKLIARLGFDCVIFAAV